MFTLFGRYLCLSLSQLLNGSKYFQTKLHLIKFQL